MPNLLQRQPQPSTSKDAILRASGIKKTFRMGDHEIGVLKNVDLTVQHGEFVAIEGKSGSGKSTLLHILSGLDAPDSGSVQYDGKDIAALAMAAGTMYRKRWSTEGSAQILHLIKTGLIGFIRPLVDLIKLSRLTKAGRADAALTHVRNKHFGFVFQFYHLLPELNVIENTMLAPMIEFSWLGFRANKAEIRA